MPRASVSRTKKRINKRENKNIFLDLFVVTEKNMILKVEKKEVKERLTCSLCGNLFNRLITIFKCLHTFCKICIHDKSLTEKLKACPIYKIDLGVSLFNKLGADCSWGDICLSLFPAELETAKVTNETIDAFFKSSKKKKRCLSSILDSLSRVSTISDLNLDAPFKPDELENKKLSEQVEVLPQIHRSSKPIVTYQTCQKKFFRSKHCETRVESEKSRKEAKLSSTLISTLD